MKKIYLATVNSDSSIIQTTLMKIVPDCEITIIGKEFVAESLKSPFYMLIAPLEYVDLDLLKSVQGDGTVFLLGEPSNVKTDSYENLQVYKDLKELQTYLLTSRLENKILKEKKTVAPKEESPPPKEEGIQQQTTLDEKQNNQVEINNGEHEQDLEVVGENPSVIDEPNYGKPVNLDPFPPEIKIDIESNLKSKTDMAIKENYGFGMWQGHKTVGVWSPIAATGVTTFLVNFAIYLSENKSAIAILETLSENANLKNILSDYTSVPKGWRSYLEYTQKEEIEAKAMRWIYHDVEWIPIGEYELERKWGMDFLCRSIHDHIRLTQKSNVTFIDFPPGKMTPYSLEALPYLDEFWIMVDHRQKSYRYRKYIEEIIEKYHLNAKLIVNKSYSSSQAKLIVKHFDKPLLTTIPILMEAFQNEWGKKPIIKKDEARELLKPSFDALVEHLKIPDKTKEDIWTKVKRIFTTNS